MRPRLFFQNFPLWLVVLICAVPGPRAGAQQSGAEQASRFLIVLDRSAAMRRCSNAVDHVVTDLFQSGFKGEIHPGDSIGFWTYNDKLGAGFPMIVWNDLTREQEMNEALDQLRSIKFAGKARLDKALPAMLEVARESRQLTIILIFDGTQPIVGTPFDSDLNGLHKHFGKELRANHLPFVTILTARNGAIVDYTINTPYTISIPHNVEPVPLPKPAPPPEVSVAPPAPVEAPHQPIEIVMHGPQTITAPPAPSEPVATTPAPAPVAVTPAPAHVVATPTPAPVVTQPAPTAPIVVQAQPSPVVIQPQPAPAPVVAPVAVAAPTEPAPAPAPVVQSAAPVAQSAAPPESTPPAASAPSAAPPAPTIVATVTTPRGQEFALFVIAASLLVIAGALVWFMFRRGRSHSGSLISQSFDKSR